MHENKVYDVIIVGGGHAGVEASLAAARTGANTLLLTHNLDTIGQMSCNPSIGGIGKSHLVKEIDAMGGAMATAIDHAGIQFRILNASKGPAVRATRAQADRQLYKAAINKIIMQTPKLKLFQQAVDDFIMEGSKICGVITKTGLKFHAKAVVLTTGTFLGGTIHIGSNQSPGGRAGDAAANKLAERLRKMPLRVGRLKTGTPPRIDTRTINFSELQTQPGDTPLPVFSFMGKATQHPEQIPCYITHTNASTHAIIQKHLHESPMYSGQISSTGPRYCPSIEDKVVRFSERDSHQIFLEPEGLNSIEVYPNGISTSLPYAVQKELIHTIKGLEKAHIIRPGYAIEYDFFDPRDLMPSLQSKVIPGLFLAGQINGTTGYEEAAAQGLLAGVNAACFAKDTKPLVLQRQQAYLGVLIDDLITNGTQEPYRMFTSRAEYRLLLREDNADLRLTQLAKSFGLISEQRWAAFKDKKQQIENEHKRLSDLLIRPESAASKQLGVKFGKELTREYKAIQILARPEINYSQLISLPGIGPGTKNQAAAEQVMIQVKYAGYIDRQESEIKRLQSRSNTRLATSLDYTKVPGLSHEVQQKLQQVKPATIGQASRISGVTPAAISLLLVYLKKHQSKTAATL